MDHCLAGFCTNSNNLTRYFIMDIVSVPTPLGGWHTAGIFSGHWQQIEMSRDETKVQVGNDQEMAQSERNSHSVNRGVGKN